MFTGIVEARGRVARLEPVDALVEIDVDVPAVVGRELKVGASVAIDGACLTVTRIRGTRVSFQAVRETLERTSLGDRKVGDAVNLERALQADSRLDGHLVQGHVDGTGRVQELRRDGPDVRMRIACGAELLRLLVPKGSVAIDGVSLTVLDVQKESFSVALIPHTLAETTLGARAAGDAVNLEADILGKYVFRYLSQREGIERD